MWNYRVIRKPYDYKDLVFEEYNVHEVFYDDNGNIESWTTEPISPYGDTLEELKNTLEKMLEALEKPILQEDETNGILYDYLG